MRSAAIGMTRIGFILLGLILMCHPGWASAERNIQRGLWEITIQTEMADTRGDALLPDTRTYCIIDQDEIPGIIQQNHTCQITGLKTEGKEASWHMRCRDRGNIIRGMGKITYKGNRFDGIVNLRIMSSGGEPIQLLQRIKGKRIRECP